MIKSRIPGSPGIHGTKSLLGEAASRAANGVGFIQKGWRIGNVKINLGGEKSV